MAQSDAPESIRLYHQAQTVFRSVGTERGVASVLNNLGLIYETQGDLTTAEKMHREALASFRRLDDKKREAAGRNKRCHRADGTGGPARRRQAL
jgi:hypothetical protein